MTATAWTDKPITQPQDKYVLRMPDGLRERVKAAAASNGRSMNTEIVRLIEAGIQNSGFTENEAPEADSMKYMREHVASIEYELGDILRDIKSLKKYDRDLADVVVSFEKRIAKLESGAPTSHRREAAEVRKAASMLYARSKQLEAE